MNRLKSFGIAISLVFAAALPVAADDACNQAPFTAKKQLEFTRGLLDDAEYFRAVGEGRRYLSFYESCGRIDEARLYIGLAYQRAEQWDRAAEVFRSMAEGASGPTAAMAHLALADTLFRQGRYELAAAEYSAFAAKVTDPAYSGYARYREGFAYFIGRAPDKAATAFRLVSDDAPEKGRAERMQKSLALADDLPYRSPTLAGVMSAVLPGAGQVYTGRWVDGVISLIVNAGFGFGAYEAYRRDLPVVATMVALFEVGWYTGNIFSAVNYAHRYNERAYEGYQREWMQRELVERDWASEAAGETRYLRFGLDFE